LRTILPSYFLSFFLFPKLSPPPPKLARIA
jgi:hypothetical protein